MLIIYMKTDNKTRIRILNLIHPNKQTTGRCSRTPGLQPHRNYILVEIIPVREIPIRINPKVVYCDYVSRCVSRVHTATCETWELTSLCLPVRPYSCLFHATTDGFSWNFTLRNFVKICRRVSILVKSKETSSQELRTVTQRNNSWLRSSPQSPWHHDS
jgi:hypothetical protein